MASGMDYVCTDCGQETQRELLTVRKVVFLEMGLGGRTVRSRVVGWLCPRCTAKDADWNKEAFKPPVAKARTRSNNQIVA